MSDLALFLAGAAITIPAAAGIVGLLLAALADGRDNNRRRESRSSEGTDA
jgi:hypothetical protein